MLDKTYGTAGQRPCPNMLLLISSAQAETVNALANAGDSLCLPLHPAPEVSLRSLGSQKGSKQETLCLPHLPTLIWPSPQVLGAISGEAGLRTTISSGFSHPFQRRRPQVARLLPQSVLALGAEPQGAAVQPQEGIMATPVWWAEPSPHSAETAAQGYFRLALCQAPDVHYM